MPDLTYTNRDYTDFRAKMLADAANKLQEWTNFNTGELGVGLVELLAAGLDILSYSLDTYAAEAFLDTAVTKESVQRLLQLIGYVMRRRVAAVADVTFQLVNGVGVPTSTTGTVTIPAGTTVTTAEGVRFITGTDAFITAGATQPASAVRAYQGTLVSETFTITSNNGYFEYVLAQTNVAENFVVLTVDGVAWTEERKATPVPSGNNTIYRIVERNDDSAVVQFSPTFGSMPSVSQIVTVQYLVTDGTRGNVGAKLISTVATPPALPNGYGLRVSNAAQAGGGMERETVDEARVNGPRSLRTLDRAVTVQDYRDLLSLNSAVDAANVLSYRGFVACFVRLLSVGGVYPQLKMEAPGIQNIQNVSTTGGSIPSARTVVVAVTAVDGNGRETSYRRLDPINGAAYYNPAFLDIASGPDSNRVSVKIFPVAGAVSYNVYVAAIGSTPPVGAIPGTFGPLRLFAENVLPANIVSTDFAINTLPSSTARIAPTENMTGYHNPSTGRSYYQDLYDQIAPKAMLGNVFDLYDATANPITLSINIYCKDQFRRSDVDASVRGAVASYFAVVPIGQTIYLTSIESYIFSACPGVRNVGVVTPANDVTMGPGAYGTLDTLTLNMSGGISG